MENGSKIAIIGGGIAGLTAAYLLQKKHDVTLLEKEDCIGGHAKTFIVRDGVDAGTPLDLGFQVFNDRSYPTFTKLLAEFSEVNYKTSDVSWSYFSRLDDFHYSLKSAKPMGESYHKFKPKSPRVAELFKQIWEFKKLTNKHISSKEPSLHKTLIDYLNEHNFSRDFIESYVIPFGSLIWSLPSEKLGDFPAKTFIYYLKNHGILELKIDPKWQYVEGGSQSHVRAILKRLRGKSKIKTKVPIDKVIRSSDRVAIHFTEGGSAEFDYAVIATHADEALNLLGDPSEKEARLLGAWHYHANRVVLHTDPVIMPPDKSQWSSWNYTRFGTAENDYNFSYYLNSVAKHKAEKDYFLTLNESQKINRDLILTEVNFTHQIYSKEAIASQPRLSELNGEKRTYYCGSYFGCGFHEDAVKSGLAVARSFGIEL